MITDFPVRGFPMQFTWQDTKWVDLFNKQVELIQQDIFRARVQGKLVIYLSCPISSRGGGYSGTNIEITEFTRLRIMKEWGTGFWILNPASYQMESKGGTGLMHHHARDLWGDKGEKILSELVKNSPAKDGDYMRMWTRVLVEDGKQNLGFSFDGFYFLGPSDVKAYFLNSEDGDLTASIEDYFSRKFSMDPDFRDYFSVPGINWGATKVAPRTAGEQAAVDQWQRLRQDFFRFYSLKAGVNYSLGSHDEWNIWHTLNSLRLNVSGRADGIANQIAGFFDGRQVTPADYVSKTAPGYETIKNPVP